MYQYVTNKVVRMSNTTFPGSPITAGSANPILAGNKVIHKSDLMKQVMRMVDRVAPSNASVLVLGESGTGKELLAHAIHSKSQRRDKPFVAINCGALRENLLESELFGHEKGAFTGAYAKKIGLAEMASGGTLFLDEIGELSPGMQAKLLRFIQEGEVYRVGGKEPIKVDIRLISATNRELDAEVMKGTFREDLYYRINTITVHSPPLRRRKEDISLLVDHFLSKNTSRILNRGRKMSDEAMSILMKYDWPGNIRELQNLCERLQILADGEVIMTSDLPDTIVSPENRISMDEYDPSMTLYELEKRHIIKALNYFEGNKTQAANALGITIKTLYNKLHGYGEFEKFAIHSKPKKA